jgi:hypothetical protein
MLTRCLGGPEAGELAAAVTFDDAVRLLRTTPYRHDLDAPATPADAQRAVAATLLWHLRVLAGWQPRRGSDAVRLLAAGFEIANVEDHLRSLSDTRRHRPGPSYRLGALATAWPRLARTGSPAELRSALAASPWRDPGGDSPAAVATGMRITAAARTAAAVPQAAPWAAGRLALLLAREVFLAGRRPARAPARRAAQVLGTRAVQAASFAEFRRWLPPAAQWAVAGIDEPGDLWRAEARWWTRLEQDGIRLLNGIGFGPSPLVGAVAVLSVDAWRVRAGLELAARGGGSLEALHAPA